MDSSTGHLSSPYNETHIVQNPLRITTNGTVEAPTQTTTYPDEYGNKVHKRKPLKRPLQQAEEAHHRFVRVLDLQPRTNTASGYAKNTYKFFV
ncbi:hypothetical protein AYL99_12029 [Fonsecaea erecta]|uniref:Uncharacterized protein n=1 Tax=Fonsecaea erecta TaxID=1367422 RepID=A0A178Z3J4_9EURO|nr:hypothetical protein AYL99_12029 [Fonsecaea erecta]OAP53773.1 hypothetical protein AYL99_12029 [Fonsecaea erecta]